MALNENITPAGRELLDGARAALDRAGAPKAGRGLLRVPGRIEVLGKHTDYAGGRSLLCTTEQALWMAVAPRGDATVRVIDVSTGAAATFALSPDLVPAAGEWSNYPMTVARRVARNFPGRLRGIDLAIASDLPRAAGMSSSSAVVVGTFLALARANDLERRDEYRSNVRTPEDLSGYLGTVENGQTFAALVGDRGVGTFGGSEDHTAILHGRAGHLSQYAFCPVRLERVLPLGDRWRFVVADSGVIAEKTGAALARYNRASRITAAMLEAWRAASGRADTTIRAAIVDAGLSAVRDALAASRHPEFAPADFLARLAQFHAESEQIIPAVADLLAAGRTGEIGQLVDRSQAGAAERLGNQVGETIFLAASARDLGAAAASSFGAGFGGSVWALVPDGDAPAFADRWRDAYAKHFPEPAVRSRFLITRPAGGAGWVNP